MMTSPDPRKALTRAVNTCRRALVGDRKKEHGDLGDQLDAPYGFDPKTGAPAPLESLTHLRPEQRGVARQLRDWHAHLVTAAAGATEDARVRAAYDQMKYELGYTALHRICALRMVEARMATSGGQGMEFVSQKRNSSGFKLYLRLADDIALGMQDDAYNLFLARLYDEMARTLPAVFDRRAPGSLLAPSPDAVTELLNALMVPELESAWESEETLGWIFEDYNDPDERTEMREHNAPRSLRELAVRNQFFTPRWVVEFLTDNTLGRLWFELTAGHTALRDNARYLARTLEAPPTPTARDPRDLRVLDPACGSGHFLLYAYDLFEDIYREAWTQQVHRSPERTPLWEEFPDEDAFVREIPRLILAHNLYGVDIDPRCVQEAALTLWLRAQRAWQRLDVRPRDRPAVSSVNLVCAQSLPDAPQLLSRLLERLQPAVLGRIAAALLSRAAELGVLQRAETAIADTVAAVRDEYLTWKRDERVRSQGTLATVMDAPAADPQREFAELDAMGDAAFWREAEARLANALERLTEEPTGRDRYRSRLFADELRHGMEFHGLSRLRFDVILMNPPFGEPTEATKDALDRAYPKAGHDLYAMFYERALEMLAPGGRVGAITNRSWLALPSFEAFRAMVLGGTATVETAADLGYGVLNAKVETAAAVIRQGGDVDAKATWIRLVKTSRKEETLREALAEGAVHRSVSVVPARHFEGLPARVCGYWLSAPLRQMLAGDAEVESVTDRGGKGTDSGKDPRFLRLAWEVDPREIGLTRAWARLGKGGEHRHFFDDVHLTIRWKDFGREIRAFPASSVRNSDDYGFRAVTWPRRTNLRLSVRCLPEGCAFGDKGPAIIAASPTTNATLLAVLNSAPTYLLLTPRFGNVDDSPAAMAKSYEVGLIRDLPWPTFTDAQSERLGLLATQAADVTRLDQIDDDESGETTVAFAAPTVLLPTAASARAATLADAVRTSVALHEDRFTTLAALQAEIDAIVADAYGFSDAERAILDAELEPPLQRLPGAVAIDADTFRDAYLTKKALDGVRLPGGLDAERDVRVESRRKKSTQHRDEATLCRLFDAPPAQIVALRRRLELLRPDDVRRGAADIVSYAVGVAFGRWDLRLVESPGLIPRFDDPFDALPACPLGQLVDQHGFPATAERIASPEWLALRTHPTRLPKGPTGSYEVGAKEYPVAVAWDGVLTDDALDDDATRRPDVSFLARVDAVLERLFGAARPAWEHAICEALGVATVAQWLRAPSGFFDDHLGRYSKSRRQAPIYWPLTTASGGLTYWVYAPRFDAKTLPLLVNRLRDDLEALRDAQSQALTRAAADRAEAARAERLKTEIGERGQLQLTLTTLVARGYAPHPDDGAVVTAAPLHACFRLSAWREELRRVWGLLEKEELDWAHLAMALWPERIMEKCVSDRSLAIAHGREDLLVEMVKAKKGRAKKGAAKPTGGATKTPVTKSPVTKTAATRKGATKKGATREGEQMAFGAILREEKR